MCVAVPSDVVCVLKGCKSGFEGYFFGGVGGGGQSVSHMSNLHEKVAR